ncbi:hypothetical protein COCON_G00111570 [Conger conger]|uniref:Centromere protein N n=1 Tax=Conger conger TaxID=82655 RepID=A0A9Q1DJY6_CONCO|nr:centromere protein N [Conger conger]KAJ8272298.1 hypothetical protein COCON_G00111570 [Conger conger]
MDDSVKQVLRQIIRRIPSNKLRNTLSKWEHISKKQFQSLEFTQAKSLLCDNLLSLCEENELSMKHVTELEMIYRIEHPAQGSWNVCQLIDPEEEALTVDSLHFKESFKAHLKCLINHVSVKMKKHEDDALWIRIAWGDNFTQPNHLKPTYVVHNLQTPYVFVSGLTMKHRPLLHQALVQSGHYGAVKDVHLSGRCLTALRDLLMRQYKQVFPVKHPKLLEEKTPLPRTPCIEIEDTKHAENRMQMAAEAFGEGILPKLETAVYKLETRFKENEMGREEPFRGVVKFASSNLLESLKYCVSSGMASAPVTPLLSSITQKGRNYFVITDKGPGISNTPGPKI